MKQYIKENSEQVVNYVFLGITCICWGWADNLAKHGLVYFSTYEVGVLRIFISALLFTPIAILKIKHLKIKYLHIYALVSFFGTVLPAFLYAQSQARLDGWITTIVSATGPTFTLLLTKFVLKNTLRHREVLGVALGLVGSIVFTFGLFKSVKGDTWYAVFPILAALSYSITSIILNKHLKGQDIIGISSFGLSSYLIFSSILLFFFTSIGHKLETVEGAYKGLMYVTLVSFCGTAIGFLCYNILTDRVSPLFASIAKLIAPILSIIISMFDGEKITFTQFMGVGIIMMSIYFIIFQKKKKVIPCSEQT